jgi:hypothetical protein
MTRLNVMGGPYVNVIDENFSGSIDAADLLALNGDIVRIERENLEIYVLQSDLAALAGILDFSGINGGIYITITDYDGSDLTLAGFGGLAIYSAGPGSDPMFDYWVSDNRLYSRRRTDYSLILEKNDKRAGFLNMIRARNPNDKVLARLDRTASLPELYAAMGKTMFFNPLVLNDGLKRLASRPEFRDDDEMGFYAAARPAYGGANYGGDFTIGFAGKDYSVSAGAYAGRISENDDYKYGDAEVSGAGARMNYRAFGFGVKILSADWKNVAIMSDGGIMTEAKSRLFYGFLDFSPTFGHIQPIARLGYFRSQSGGFSDESARLDYGGRVFFCEEKLGVKNRYGAYAMKNGDEFDYGLSADYYFSGDGAAVGVMVSPSNLSVETRVSF